MKRTLIYIVALLALVSCQKDPEIPIVSLTVQDKVEAEWLDASLSGSAVANTKVENLFVQVSTDEGFGTVTEVQTAYDKGQFKTELSNLTPQTTYYYRYRAVNKLGSFVNQQILTFRTKDFTVPVVSTDLADHITGKKASLYGTIVFDCAKQITDRGFEYGTDESHLTKVAVDGEDFAKQLLQLHFNTQYYYRAYATSEIGTGYGNFKSFKTCDVVKFGAIKVDSIMVNSARAEYSISSNGGMPILNQGLQCWKKGAKDSTKVETNKAVKFTKLEKEQTYQLRAYAVTEDGCLYSEVDEFTTKNGVISLRTTTPTDVSYTSVTLGGQITDDGGATIIKRGVCWNTQSSPTTAHSKKIASGNTFTFSISNLNNVTTYYVRAYAVNQYGTYYGKEQTFTTIAYTKPAITTSNVANISYSSATCGGNVTDNGGVAITERGICYAITTNPTISNTKKTSGTGTGSFSCDLTGLIAGTTYYVRAYATNSKGTSYGELKTFSTTAYSKPTVTTSVATNISATSATCGGNVTDDGGVAVTERGICYAATSNPTISNTKVVASGIGTGTFSCLISSLTSSTTYYVRAYAINSKGTSYGEVKSFITGGSEAGHEWVDLGLSVKWATMNVGATMVTGYGNYYAWGETSPKTTYNYTTYKYCKGTYDTMTKYCVNSSRGTVDNKTILEKADDAAYVNWGGNWRMPTKAEQEELKNNCTVTCTSNYQGTGVAGRIFTSNKTGYTNKSIFLPTAGSREGADLRGVGSSGYYWSSSLGERFSNGAFYLVFYSDTVYTFDYLRSYGYTVRAVCP